MIHIGNNGTVKEMWAVARVYQGNSLIWSSEWASGSYGALTVTYSGTAPSGAKWSVDAGTTWNDFGTQISLEAGNYTVTYKAVSGYTTPSSQSATVTAGQIATVSANAYAQLGALQITYSGTAPSGAAWSHNGGSTWNNFGDSVAVSAGSYTITFKDVSGYTTPTQVYNSMGTDLAGSTVTVSAGSTTSRRAQAYVVATGTVMVKTSVTIPTGAAWSIDGGTTWNYTFGSSGAISAPAGTCTVVFKDVSGYMTPSSQTDTVTVGGNTTFWLDRSTDYAAYQLYIEYPLVGTTRNPAGAQWSIDGGTTWHDFRTYVGPISVGTYTIVYKPVTGYNTPSNESVTITGAQQNTVHEISSNNLYTVAVSYPNAFVVSGLPTNVDQTTAQFNGTYTKTNNVITYDGVDYPIYYNGVNYLFMYSATSAKLASSTGASGDAYYVISNISGMNAAQLTGTWNYAYPSGMLGDSYSLTVTESSSTTPEAGTFVDPEDEPTTPTEQYLTVSGCATAAMNGTYYFIVGDGSIRADSGAGQVVLRHADGHYYIIYYNGGSQTTWYVANGQTTASSPIYEIALSRGTAASTFGGNGLTNGNITTTYVDTSSSSSSSSPSVAYLSLTSPSGNYDGNYLLASGNANGENSVWKHSSQNYYIYYYGHTPSWGLFTSASGGNGQITYLSDSRVGAASTQFSGGATYNGYTITYHAS